jgi:hypothetical protein
MGAIRWIIQINSVKDYKILTPSCPDLSKNIIFQKSETKNFYQKIYVYDFLKFNVFGLLTAQKNNLIASRDKM